jgi:signal transduction histidine kinase
MLGRFRIGQKLALLVVIPLAFSTVVGSQLALDARQNAHDARELTKTIGLLDPTLTLIQSIRTEVNAVRFGLDSPQFTSAVAEVDAAFANLTTKSDLNTLGNNFEQTLVDAQANVTAIRSKLGSFGDDVKRMWSDPAFIVTPRGGEIGNTITSYTPQSTALIVNAINVTAEDVHNADVLDKTESIKELVELTQRVSEETLALSFAIQNWDVQDPGFTMLLSATVARSETTTDVATANVLKNVGTEITTAFAAIQNKPDSQKLTELRLAIASRFGTPGGGGVKNSIPLPEAGRLFAEYEKQIGALLDTSSQRLIAETSAAADEAEQRSTAVTLAVLVMLSLVIGLSVAIYRSVVIPIRTLTRRTKEVAETELPSMMAKLREFGADDSVPTPPTIHSTSQDEVSDLVKAFNSLQATTIDLAAAQARSRRNVAEMFVNLGRRNQKLLSRQLALLDEFQKDEVDPQKLSELYAVDHIATRMRRNAESLLVLAGTVPPRQFTQPVPIGDVLRGALAEVEGFQRVRIDGTFDNVSVNGAAAADVTHLIAELLENALRFSPEDSPVQVITRATEERCIVHVSDAGMGMSPSKLVELTKAIEDAADTDEVPTRQLGLFVVAKLASRHNITVTLHEGNMGGLAIRLSLPTSVVRVALGPTHQVWQVGEQTATRPARLFATPSAEAPQAQLQAAALAEANHAVQSQAAVSLASPAESTEPAKPAEPAESAEPTTGLARRTRKAPLAVEAPSNTIEPERELVAARVAPDQVAANLAGLIGGFRRSSAATPQATTTAVKGNEDAS